MGFTEIALYPFQKWFRPTPIYTPFSTIRLPNTLITMIILFFSFFIICAGFIFCHVRGMPMIGYIRGRDGRPIPSWIDLNSLGNQFLAEGIVASLMFSLTAASLIAAAYTLSLPDNRSKSDLELLISKFALTSPIWCLFSYLIFHSKIPSFSPRFRA